MQSLAPFPLWGQTNWCNQEVVGESHYERALRQLCPRNLRERQEVAMTATLVPEPRNRHDPNAVAVRVGGETIGYLAREVARTYQPLLLGLAEQRRQAEVPCRIWAGIYDDYDYDRKGRLTQSERFSASVRIALDEPHLCVPANGPPSQPHVLMPRGGTIQISGEDKCMAAITPFLRLEGSCMAHATLHEVEEKTARSTREIVEVRLDGERVGQLTPKMSGDLLPAIRHLESRGHLAAAVALVKGNRMKAEVVLYAARAHELPPDWGMDVPHLSRPRTSPERTPVKPEPANVTPAAPIATPTFQHAFLPPKPTRIRYNSPPGWPVPPPGWEPFPGWLPSVEWPPAPEGWRFWIAE